jgi:hypothetical protein
VVFVDDRVGQQMSATMTIDRLAQPLSSYVDEVVREVAARVKSARVQERTDAHVGERQAVFIEQLLKPNTGTATVQRQAFINDGDQVMIISVTSDAEAGARVRTCLAELLSSLRKVPSLPPTEEPS